MTFLAPLALLGTLLLLLPIVVHLFKPRKMRHTPFSSLRWLKQTHQRLSRRVQWHQWILFLMRAACILLFVLALAKPLVGDWGQERATDRVIVLDASRGMAYQTFDQTTPMQRAVELVASLVEHARPGDRTALVLAGSPPRLIAPLSADASGHLAALKANKAGLADGNLSGTLPLVHSLLAREDGQNTELVFVTDNLKPRWRQNDIQAFLKEMPSAAKVKVIEVGIGSPVNGWIANARLFRFGPDEDRWLRVEAGSVGDAQSVRSVRLAGIVGLSDDVQEIALKAGQIARVDFKIPAGIPLQGQVAEVRLEPGDSLPSDDVFFLNLDEARSTQVLLIEPEAGDADGRKAGHYLRQGMDALIESKKRSLEVRRRTAAEVTEADFRTAQVIVLAGVPELSDSALEALEARVRLGAGLALFLGPQIKTAFYDRKLYRPTEPQGLMPFALKSGAGGPFTEGKPGVLANLLWKHPLLSALRDPVHSDLLKSDFRVYALFEGIVGKSDTVIARFDDEVPAIVERPVGQGRVLLFNTTANTQWSNLPVRKSFIVLLDRMLSYLATSASSSAFKVGDMATLPIAELTPGSEVTVQTPGGTKFAPRIIRLRGQTLLHLDALNEAGIYRVEGTGNKNFTFVVNASRSDSSLSPMDDKALAEWWSPASLEIENAETALQRLEQQPNHWPVWPMLIVLAGLFLVGETVYVHRLCPRANPKVASEVISRRGAIAKNEQVK